MLLIQLPPYLTIKKGFNAFTNMVSKLDERFKYSVEFRDPSWFSDDVYEFLKQNSISLVWSVRDELKTLPIVTSDQVYIRFIGDRSIQDKDFGKIVRDRRKEMLEYVKRINEVHDDISVRDIVIAFNNHYAGFGPQSVNDLLNLMGEHQIDWKSDLEKMKEQNGSTLSTDNLQRSMSDFTA